VTRRVDFHDWQRVRAAITATQTRSLAATEDPEHRPADACHPAGPRAERPAEGRPLHSHKPRSDDEWAALEDGVRALLAELESTGRLRRRIMWRR
jgi:hypothetical protein